MIRQPAGLSVARFCALAGIPRATWYRQRARALAGTQPTAVAAAGARPRARRRARLRAALSGVGAPQDLGADRRRRPRGLPAHRASHPRRARAAAPGPLQGRAARARPGAQADVPRPADATQPRLADRLHRAGDPRRRHLAAVGVIDYVTKFCLTCPVTATKTWREAAGALEAAREHASEVLGAPLIADLVDRQTGELTPIKIVTDNGPCYKAAAFARYIASRPEFEHVRTRHRSPETNGVIERFNGSMKYEHLYLHEIDDGPTLAEHVLDYQRIYNDERPHEAISWARPRDRYTNEPT